MRRRISLFLAALLALLLAACGPAQSLPPAAVDTPAVETVTPTPAPETAMPTPAPETAMPTPVPAPETDAPAETLPAETPEIPVEAALSEDGSYTTKEDVALYLHLYGHLPDNFITKREAEKLGWTGGSLEPYAPGMCIGGNRFGNYEGLLPEADGRIYTECDIDTLGASKRGAKRIVFSNDGLIYYTEDHYESFELLYGEADP